MRSCGCRNTTPEETGSSDDGDDGSGDDDGAGDDGFEGPFESVDCGDGEGDDKGAAERRGPGDAGNVERSVWSSKESRSELRSIWLA